MFLDETILEIKTGKGGNGCKSFHRQRFQAKGGPDGGNGGKGGDIFLKASENLHTLYDLQERYFIKTEAGSVGKDHFRNGRDGKDITLLVPIGTSIFTLKQYNNSTNETLIGSLNKHHDILKIALGGKGGKGNNTFKTAQNKAPEQFTQGKPGEHKKIKLELKLIADCGLVGFPNAGKSSIISKISNSKSKVGDYAFTTLKPHLGIIKKSYGSFVLADIPGLIKDASKGKGLGNQFLRHIEKCSCLAFVLDLHNKSWEQYQSLLLELKQYNKVLLERPQIILLNKIDLGVLPIDARFQQPHIQTILTSAVSGVGLEEFTSVVMQLLNKLNTTPEWN